MRPIGRSCWVSRSEPNGRDTALVVERTGVLQGVNRVAGTLLRAKSWQIFLLLGGTYLLGSFGIVSLESTNGQGPSALVSMRTLLLAEAFMAPCVLSTASWLWSMGSFLNSGLKPELRVRSGFFRFALVFATLYLLAGLPLFLIEEPGVERFTITLHLFALVCMLYTLGFVAKCLVTKNRGETVVFRDYTMQFFLLFFAPIGIWLIQPRINQLYAESSRSR
jgi:hypothetical protein